MYIGEKENVVPCLTAGKLVEDFKSYLKDIGYGESTCSMLPECIRDFLSYTGTEPEETTQTEIQSFYDWLQIRPHKRREGGISGQYINHHVYALRTFFNWLEETGAIRHNPISIMKFKSQESSLRHPLTKAEIQELFEACNNQKETAILHLFYSCGLRRSEAAALNVKDIHFKKHILYVREGKGDKRRAVPMTWKVTAELESYYLQERLKQTNSKEAESFMLNRTGKRMSGDSYNNALKKVIARTTINPKTSLHYLRHSIASHLLESGLSVEYVRDFLGHKDLESTQVYAKVNQKQLMNL